MNVSGRTKPSLSPFALAVGASLFVFSSLPSSAEDWPQWLGPRRDGVWRESNILQKFPTDGPPVRWRVSVGAGYSGPSVAAGRVYITDRMLAPRAANPKDPFQRGAIPGSERVLCIDAASGELLWKHEYDCAYNLAYPAGPRAHPLIDGNRVYTLGAEGDLLCLDASKGTVIWSLQLKKEFGAETPLWGFSAHPIIEGNKLICMVGGKDSTVVAFDKETGAKLWNALSAPELGYCPPMIFQAGGRRQLIIWHPRSLNSLNPDTGELLWTEPFAVKSGLTIPTPRLDGDQLLVTSFYNGSLMMRLAADQPSAQVMWRGQSQSERKTDGLHAIMSTPFLENGYIYGVCSYGQLRCLKAQTGERVWETFQATGGKEVRWANAFLVKNGDRFFLSNEQGDLVIAQLTPAGYEEISRAHILDPTNSDPGRPVVWSHPAFANRSVYARNDKELVCADLSAP